MLGRNGRADIRSDYATDSVGKTWSCPAQCFLRFTSVSRRIRATVAMHWSPISGTPRRTAHMALPSARPPDPGTGPAPSTLQSPGVHPSFVPRKIRDPGIR